MGRAARFVGRAFVGTLALGVGLAAHPPFIYEPKFMVRPSAAPREPTAAERLDARLERMGRDFGGRIGIAVYNVNEGWAADYDGDALLPQQSVSKLWVSVAVLDRVDRGELTLDDRVLIRKEDLSLFHQPIREQVGEHGYVTTVRDLMRRAITQSDNAANDALIRKIGGPWSVQVTVVAKNLGEIRFGPGEREMQTAAAGLTWKPEYSFDRHFWEDREALPQEVRGKALGDYLANPPDGASALDIAETLGRLKGGGLLSPESTAHLLALMADTSTGSSRLRAGLAPGWVLQHKTGTGQVNGDLATGYNDVGLLTAPDGTSYAVAVLIGASRRPFKERSALIADVARTVIAAHEAERPPPVTASSTPSR